ncbi:Protein transport protein Sec23A [Asimina triloba]
MDALRPSANSPTPHPDKRPPLTTDFFPQTSPQDSHISLSKGIKTRNPIPHLIFPSHPSPTQFGTPPGLPSAHQFSALHDPPLAPQFNTPPGHSLVPQCHTSPGLPPAPQFNTPTGRSPVPQSNTSRGLPPAQFNTPEGHSTVPRSNNSPGLPLAPQFNTSPGHSLVPQSNTSHGLHPAHQFNDDPPHPSPAQFNSPGPFPHSQFKTTGLSPIPCQFNTPTSVHISSQFSTPTNSSISPQFNTPPGTSPLPKFNTPPGPPVFSSPVQPAAVPFQTAPEPLMFSTSKLPLPASSLPLFTNGSADCVCANESILDGALPYVLFSAHKVLKQKKLANISSFGFGALVSPGREIASGPQIVQHQPHRCQNCGAYSNLYCTFILASGRWQCIICKNLNESEGDYVAGRREELQNWPELVFPMVDYIESGNRLPGFMPVSSSRISTSIFLVIDECLDEAHLQHLQSSLHAFVDSLSTTTRIGIISFGRTVSVYDFSHGSKASADVLPGDSSPTQESLKSLIYGTGVYMSLIHASLPVAHMIFSSMRAYKLNLPEPSRDRCIGTAVEVALALIQGPSAEMSQGVIKKRGGNCRILVCVGGPNTYGPGSVPHSVDHLNYLYMEKMAVNYMEHVGLEAYHQNTKVDILCAGTCPVRVPVLLPLAKASGGMLVIHDDFGEAFGMNLRRASAREAGYQGLLQIRCSDDILVTRVIGPGEEAPADVHKAFKNDTAICIRMCSVEESQSFALSMELNDDIKKDHVFFQFAVQYSTVQQANISRVITVKLPTADNVSSYLASVQDDVAAVLIAKRTVLQAKTSLDAVDMQLTIDERVKDIAARFGHKLPQSKFYQFPRELSTLPEYLFHLRRGPLLGGIVRHEDERSVLRNFFLNASFDLSLQMVAPRCLMHREGGIFEELPAHDLAMQSDVAVVLDHGADVFIWMGSELVAQEGRSAAALAACRTLAEELTEHRFPAPRILIFKEGSSEARYILSRLIPAHKDLPYEQTVRTESPPVNELAIQMFVKKFSAIVGKLNEARFPQLRSLTAEQRAKLKNSFLSFDDFSYCEWMRSLKLVPPEPT